MLSNLVEETANNPGTGLNVSLLGAMTNRRDFVSAFGNGATVYYALTDGSQSEWGIGTVQAGVPNLLVRTTVLGNSAGTIARLNFTGACRVYNEIPAERMAYLSAGGILGLTAQEASAYALLLRARSDGAAVLGFTDPSGATERARLQSDSASNLDFGTGPVASSKMRLTVGGALGIGTLFPGAPLHVRATVAGTALMVQQTQTAAPGVQVWYNGSSYNFYTRVEQNTGNFEWIDNGYANTLMQLTQAGSLFNKTGAYGTVSDHRLKENIVTARDYTDDLLLLEVVRYSLKAERLANPNLLGLIAQQVQQVFPGLVEEIPGAIPPEMTAHMADTAAWQAREAAAADAWEAAAIAWRSEQPEGSLAEYPARNAEPAPVMPDLPPAQPILALKTAPLLMMLLRSHQSLVRRVEALEAAAA